MTGHFLQSKEWEEFQKSVGREVFRIDGALITKLPLIFGKTYFYCGGCNGCLTFNVKQVSALAKQEGAVFLKVEPMSEDKNLVGELLKAGFKKSKKEIQPQRTIVLDLTQSEEGLLAEMHQKTRYNIRVAERQGVRVVKHETCSTELIEEFWNLLEKTTIRDKFSSHPRKYYYRLCEELMEKISSFKFQVSGSLFTAEYKNKTIAADIVLFCGDIAYYLHGASDYEYRSFMAPYLLHWETIKHAKERGYKEYDFWGIDEKRWPGLTRFKKGFGGRELQYIGSYDFVFRPLWYRIYSLRNKIK